MFKKLLKVSKKNGSLGGERVSGSKAVGWAIILLGVIQDAAKGGLLDFVDNPNKWALLAGAAVIFLRRGMEK